MVIDYKIRQEYIEKTRDIEIDEQNQKITCDMEV